MKVMVILLFVFHVLLFSNSQAQTQVSEFEQVFGLNGIYEIMINEDRSIFAVGVGGFFHLSADSEILDHIEVPFPFRNCERDANPTDIKMLKRKNEVWVMIQDGPAAADKNLYRYDGLSLDLVSPSDSTGRNSFVSNTPRAFAVSPVDSSLWYVGSGGFFWLDSTWNYDLKSRGKRTGDIIDMWFVSDTSFVFMEDFGKMSEYNTTTNEISVYEGIIVNDDNSPNVSKLATQNDGIPWVINRNGLWSIIDSNWVLMNYPDFVRSGFPNYEEPLDVFVDGVNDVWFGLENRLALKRDSSWVFLEGLNRVYDIDEDNFGRVYLATCSGITVVDKDDLNNIEVVSNQTFIGFNTYKAYEDNEGNKWFLTSYGVSREKAGDWSYYPIQGRNGIALRDLYTDSEGVTWILGYDEIYQIKDDVLTEFTEIADFIKRENLRFELNWDLIELLEDKGGQLWFISRDHFIRYDKNGEMTFKSNRIEDFRFTIGGAMMDKNGAVWFAAEDFDGGYDLVEYDPSEDVFEYKELDVPSVYSFTPELTNSGNNGRSVVWDYDSSRNQVWMAIEEFGITSIDIQTNEFVLYDELDNLEWSYIQSINHNADGDYVVGTYLEYPNPEDADRKILFTLKDGSIDYLFTSELTEVSYQFLTFGPAFFDQNNTYNICSPLGLSKVNFDQFSTSVLGSKQTNGIEIFPNPIGNESLNLTYPRDRIKSYLIYDGLGRLILSNKFREGQDQIEIQGINSGNYYILFQDHLGSIIEIKKFIKH